LLAVQNCRFRYRSGRFSLRDVSLDVPAGAVTGIIGPNGSGKSTLLRLMCGLLRPESGQVLLDGSPLGGLGRRERARKVAFLPQSSDTSFRFTARQVVAMGRYPYLGPFGFLSRRDIEAVEAALAAADVAALAGRCFSTLSGGERQRVLLAGILAQEPKVMLLDEPTAALDIHHAVELLGLLRGLSRAGIGVVTVTHDLNDAGRFCDRLVLLSDGAVARSGAPEEVMDAVLLSEVYGADVKVGRNPLTGTPLVVVAGGRDEPR